MRRSTTHRFVILMVCVSAAGLGATACRSHPENIAAGDVAEGVLTHRSRERRYLVYDPPGRDREKPCPLVIALHGGGGNRRSMLYLTKYGFNVLADRDGFVVAYPEGIDKHWNDGRDDPRRTAIRENVDDVGFIAGLIDRLVSEKGVDPKRVYVTGMSNGAMMSFRLGCDLSFKIAAIAPVAGSMPEAYAACCEPVSPMPVLIINGTEDELVPFEGGHVSVLWKKFGRVLPIESVARFWARNNKVPTEPKIDLLPDRDPDDGTRARRRVYGDIDGDAPVVIYQIDGGGHTWPGGWPYLGEWLIGPTSKELDANAVIWDFFKGRTLTAR